MCTTVDTSFVFTKKSNVAKCFFDICNAKRLMNTLVPKSFCSLEHFASQLTLHLNTFYSLAHFTLWHTLLLSTLCTSTHFDPQHILIKVALCSLEHFNFWNTLLPGTLCFKRSREQRMLRRTIYKLAKCSIKQSVPMRSKVF